MGDCLVIQMYQLYERVTNEHIFKEGMQVSFKDDMWCGRFRLASNGGDLLF